MKTGFYVLAALAVGSDAFVTNHVVVRQASLVASLGTSSVEENQASGPSSSPESIMRQDIEAMRQEAKRRLEALNQQMEELKEHAKEYELEQEVLQKKQVVPARSEPKSKSLDPIQKAPANDKIRNSLDSMEGDWVDVKPQPSKIPSTSIVLPSFGRVDTELLTDTRWKVAFSIGREAGTWMPKEWGASGDRLVFQAVVDMTNEPLYEREDFFQGPAGAKLLRVVEAWVVPVGVGVNSHGRQAIRMKPKGGYKVLPGLGPLGTNIVRFYLELEEDVRSKPDSDVYCPQGRVYATCGYFPRHQKQNGVTSLKDMAEEEHHAAMVRYEQLERQIEADERLFSLDRLKLMKESYVAKRDLEQSARRLLEARQRDPDKAMLRLTRDGRVGLTKEGGVCRKVLKGVALEYHILGRIELACIDKLESHDEYQELVHQLHP